MSSEEFKIAFQRQRDESPILNWWSTWNVGLLSCEITSMESKTSQMRRISLSKTHWSQKDFWNTFAPLSLSKILLLYSITCFKSSLSWQKTFHLMLWMVSTIWTWTTFKNQCLLHSVRIDSEVISQRNLLSSFWFQYLVVCTHTQKISERSHKRLWTTWLKVWEIS